ncbi:MAG: hypothetical protein JWN40_2186 [Phycisphaerales bacterium]|nr:hypothetical protein [Phycisphaerales bacterium]
MKRSIQFAAVAMLAAAGMAMTPGCQNVGRRDTTDRTVSSTVMYDRPYVATRDSEWLQTQTSTTRNRLPKGTRAYFADTPTTAEWQQARVEGQGVVWVHPADFAREAR